MSHVRIRSSIGLLKRKLRFSRVVSMQGARQTGKSTLARDLLGQGAYVTFDRSRSKEAAEARPGAFLSEWIDNAGKAPVIIDEAQKVPKIFDEIKSVVDESSQPGQFLLLESTEFNHETKVLESLTGRMSRLRLFPMTLTETIGQPDQQSKMDQFWKVKKSAATRSQFLRFLESGGFPAIFSIRNRSEQDQRFSEWLKLTCERDVFQIKRLKPDPDLCTRILENLPHLEEPSAIHLAQRLRVTPRKIVLQLRALEGIFAIHRISPHPLSTGKDLYFLIDSGLANSVRADFRARLNAAFLTEFYAKQSYQAVTNSRVSYYRTSKGSIIPLLIELGPKNLIAIKWDDRENLDLRELAIFESLRKKADAQGITVKSVFLTGLEQSMTVDGVSVLPWENAF